MSVSTFSTEPGTDTNENLVAGLMSSFFPLIMTIAEEDKSKFEADVLKYLEDNYFANKNSGEYTMEEWCALYSATTHGVNY